MSALPDSESRVGFGDGAAVREGADEKAAIGGISPYMLERLGMLLTKANVKYGDYRNWEKGMPFSRYIDGMGRHYCGVLKRDESEDHLAAIVWNAMCMMHHQELGEDAIWDDRPRWVRYEQQPSGSATQRTTVRSRWRSFRRALSHPRSG